MDVAGVAACAADPAGQRPHGGQAAQRQQRAHQQAQRERPEGQRHQRHGMQRERQKHQRHGAVQEAPRLVGQQPGQQRDGHHGQQQVKSHLAQVLGKAPGVGEPGQNGVACRPAGAAPQALDPVAGFIGAPVQDGRQRRTDARPLVQAVDLVHAAQRTLQPGQAQRQHHGQCHQADAPQAREIQRLLAQLPPASGCPLCIHKGRDAQLGRQYREPGQGDGQQPASQDDLDAHGVSFWCVEQVARHGCVASGLATILEKPR